MGGVLERKRERVRQTLKTFLHCIKKNIQLLSQESVGWSKISFHHVYQYIKRILERIRLVFVRQLWECVDLDVHVCWAISLGPTKNSDNEQRLKWSLVHANLQVINMWDPMEQDHGTNMLSWQIMFEYLSAVM